MPRLATLLVAVAVASPAIAGIYSPEEPCPFEVVNGVAKPLPHSRFKSLLNDRRGELNPTLPEFDEIDTPAGKQKVPTPRGKAMNRVRERMKKLDALSPTEQLALSANLIRTSNFGKELAQLNRLAGEHYLPAANAVHAEALQGNWPVAVRGFEDHVLDLDPPTELPGTSVEQLKWQLKVDKSFYRAWLRIRLADSTKKANADGQDVYPLFTGPDRTAVKFAGGALPDAEKGKLPTDAVAIMQQLALWAPTDPALLWLLAEVYAANGMLREADDAFDMCTWGAGMTGQKKLMEHRKAVRSAVEKLPPPVTEDIVLPTLSPPPATPRESEGGLFDVVSREQFYLVGGIFAAFVLVLLGFQVRAIIRRKGGNCCR